MQNQRPNNVPTPRRGGRRDGSIVQLETRRDERYIENDVPEPIRLQNTAKICRMYQDDYQYIIENVMQNAQQETGGDMFGYYSRFGDPIVSLTVGPGRNARHQLCSFNQDGSFLQQAGEVAMNFGMTHLGNWHSHHMLGLAHPSSGDLDTVFHALNHHNVDHFLLCIANIDKRTRVPTLKAFWIEKRWETQRNRFLEMEIDIMPYMNPIWNSVSTFISRTAIVGQMPQQPAPQQRPVVQQQPMEDPMAGHWSKTEAGSNFMRELHSKLQFKAQLSTENGQKTLKLLIDGGMCISFDVSDTYYKDPTVFEEGHIVHSGRRYNLIKKHLDDLKNKYFGIPGNIYPSAQSNNLMDFYD
jgi:hypothetical protein